MNSKDVLRALQAGEISYKDAEKQLIEGEKDVSVQVKSDRKEYRPLLSENKEAIAIVGTAGRYPDASDLDQYWDNLTHGKNSIKEIPKSRWDVNQYYDPRPSQIGKIYCKSLGVLDDVDYFDSLFFNISPTEAETMDPQHRIFLQEGYKAFEDAGYNKQLLNNKRCGVYLGIMSNEYGMMLYKNKIGLTNITGNSYAIAAARIPYFLNLKGPAIPIDTACSSSLVAIHLARQALLNKEIDMALVGGVSLYLAPESYISMCSAGMLSPEGQCKTFDNSANGFVPGEGVGALVLKRLKDAEADNDHIYGVIIGSGINQDGKTNGITAPSVNSQIELERSIYQSIHPESISYVEMHGTGTKLGDPIELEALSKVFKERTNQKKYCAIGSVKSNIGHTSGAAGIASIQKVLLCLKHNKLVPTLNFETPNEHFNFEDSPFYVNTQLQPWKVESGIPRRASVSAFGFSGTNAHVVIEEYIPKRVNHRAPIAVSPQNSILFVLSAKNEQQLKVYAESMKKFIEAHGELCLEDMAYTLQVGREAMNYRLAFLADSRKALLKKLEGFIDNDLSVGVLTGQVKKSREGVVIFESDEDANTLLQTWAQKGKFNKVAELWVKGLNVEWNKLYGEPKPSRISLPTYPFAKERYWIPEGTTQFSNTVNQDGVVPIHPLLHKNISDFSEQRFSSIFTGKEFFLDDHIVKEQKVLPGIAYLEMVRAAVEQAAGVLEDCSGMRLKNVVWAQPMIVADQPIQVNIGLFSGDNGEINYEIYSGAQTIDVDPIIYSQGTAMLGSGSEAPTVDIAALQGECSNNILSASQCYDAYKGLGIYYGPGYQGIEKVYVGTGQVLTKLSLPFSSSDALDQFVLHPSIMVSALQATVGLVEDFGDPELSLPISLQELEIFNKCSLAKWAVIVYSEGCTAGDKVQKIDIDLCDEQGTICVRMKGLEFYAIAEDNLALNTNSSKVQTQGNVDAVTNTDVETLRAASIEHVKELMAAITKIPIDRLDTEVSFDELGLDSIMIAQLNQKIEQWVGKLDATLFFKYNNIQTLGNYFVEEYPDTISRLANKTNGSIPKQKSSYLKEIPTLVSMRPATLSTRPMTSDFSNAHAYNTDIAIVGVAGRYPQAATLEEFWRNLYMGKDCIEEIPANRWPLEGFFESNRTKAAAQGLSYSKWGGFLENIDCFDPLFFNISPRDTMYMDPQERLFLEVAWECIENAGYTRKALKQNGYGNQIGVFVGASFNNYQLLMMEAAQKAKQDMFSVNSQIFSIANRVSYIMNFTGPSLTVDTACASSLYAVHLACESIRSGQARMAIAGGVNLSLHPSKYITISQGQFNASDGRCRAFCEGGTGYVPSEAVGAIFLKPLQSAIDDNDIIYGIIKGTSASHAGKTNGYTIPSPVSQSLAIETALKQGKINPRSISCIEAHGTGTSLGDPIEITGLTDVFRKYTKETGFCSISSVKSNIGHTEAAAGISQVTKVLLQLKHQTLVKNVMHGKGLNPNIDFGQTPFVVQENTEYWERPTIDGEKVPRRAGISSFGAGGSNAHVIIEEYIPVNPERSQIIITADNPAIVVLSAKNKGRLKEQAKQLLGAIQEQQLSDDSLADIAYTLQVGREAMEERLGLIVGSVQELREKLKGFVEGQEGDFYCGKVKRNKEVIATLAADEEIQEAIEMWIHYKEAAKLIGLWTRGLSFDWNKLYGNTKPRRMGLPTYPFAREHYWPSASAAESKTNDRAVENLGTAAVIHPLLHQNTSNLSEQRFSSIFTGREFFLADHVVKGQRVLPGMAYIEMARAAVEQAAGILADGYNGIQLRNVVWARPVAIGDQPVQIHIGLYPEDNGVIDYEIYSESGSIDKEHTVHSQGRAVLSTVVKVPALNLKSLQAQCSQSSLNSDQCYEAFKAIGIHYGPGHQGINMVYAGHEHVLAKLSLPLSVLETQNQFTLHPSLMDAALQASIGLMMGTGDLQAADNIASLRPSLPFALQSLEIMGKLSPAMWAYVRYSDGSKAGDKVQKLDIDLCDEEGNVCVQMKKFSSRVLEGELGSAASLANNEMMILEPYWQEQGLSEESKAAEYIQHVVMLCELDEIAKESIENQINGIRCLVLQSSQKGIEDRFLNYVVQAFEEIQRILKDKPKGKVLIQVVVPGLGGQHLFSGLSGLSGLLKTAQLENPKLIGQLIEVEAGGNAKEIVKVLEENSQSSKDQQIQYYGGKRYVIGWNEIQVTQEANIPWKDRGVYLITGGAGGLGLIFAKEIAHRVKDSTLILTGRSPLGEAKQAKLKELETLGARVVYKQVDVTKEKSVGDLFQYIQAEFGSLNGIIHGAGVLRDNFILKKTGDEVQEVLAPKVNGLVNLDRVSKNLRLDFFIVFSSGVGVMGNIGQADYAAANAFMDNYVKYRNTMVALNQRQGKTLSINWPLWKEGGMGVNAAIENMIWQSTGMIAMQTSTGIKALYQGLAFGKDQVRVMEGNLARIRQKLLSMSTSVTKKTETASGGIDTDSLLKKVQASLTKIVSELLKVKFEDIDVDTDLSEYGFDSITLTEFANKINQENKIEVAPTMFFEQPTLHNIAAYLIEEHQAVFTAQFGKQSSLAENVLVESQESIEIDTSKLLDKVIVSLTQTVSKLLNVKVEDIDVDTDLSEYGFDSITLTEFANKINQENKIEVAPTMFFEQPTLLNIATYLIEEHQSVFAAQFGVQTRPGIPEQVKEEEKEQRPSDQRQRSRFARTVTLLPEKTESFTPEPIAIVGMSGTFPMAHDVNEFWENLAGGKDCITEIPKERWDWREYYGDPLKEVNKTNIKWGGFIDDIDKFDSLFFGISPREAQLMDPQQRLLMTYVWKAIEDAGYSAQSLSGTKTGIFVGTAGSGYSGLISQANLPIEGYTSTGMVASVGPNRMSYFLNIHGPSEPIETACSSSLIAIHRAVSAIESGNCEMAIVGGINTILTPDAYISFNKAGMLCEDGRCKTFSDQANGYVRGEGVGMIFLKKLKDAQQAGDYIYGVIRGTAENHGGRANSLTAPNPKAQAELLKTAYTKAGFDPRTITYIETHGTGTELGDPIEINGLKTACKELYQATGDTQVVSRHCGLGSVKTNIGHLELAAGIAGVIKVLLQLKHKTLSKTLHCNTINPYIQLKDSPFYIVQETQEWKALQDDQGNDIPRRAGVSSFGFGGVNAHIVIEEYIDKEQNQSQNIVIDQKAAVVVLSAKDDERLREQAQQLLAAIQKQQLTEGNLADMAYTLQVGREAMEERLGLIVTSMKELEEKLKGFVEGQDAIEGCYRGKVKRNKESLAIFTADEDMEKTIEAWINKRKFAKILELWVKGLGINWNKFYGETKPRRISLPTYPFAKERCWVPEGKTVSSTTDSEIEAKIHPLLHQNTSKLSEQRFSSTFTGREFFITDYLVKDQRILPGAAYLEMARAAVQQSVGAVEQGETGVRLENVVWAEPIVIADQPIQVHIGLFPEDNGKITYEIYSDSEEIGAEPVVHGQGNVLLHGVGELPTLDLKVLREQCNLSRYNLEYQGIEEVYVGHDQVLVKLFLPASLSNTKDQFVLHPNLLDSALQASLALLMDLDDFKLSMPFALDELEAFRKCTPSMWAVMRCHDGSTAGNQVKTVDIDLCDEQGNVCVRMKGFSSRVIEGEKDLSDASASLGSFMLRTYWQEQKVAKEAILPVYDQHLAILYETNDITRESIEGKIEGLRCLIVKSQENSITDRYLAYAARAFEEIQSILKEKPMGKVLIQVVVPTQDEQQLFTGLSGILKTAQLENPKIIGQLIEIGTGEDEEAEAIIAKLQENSQSPSDNRIRYQDGKRWVASWRELETSPEELERPWKDKGVYVITGGSGGLGLIFAKEIVNKAKGAILVLTGRSLPSEDKQAQFKELEALGARVEYRQADVTKEKAVAELFQSIREDFGSINGIIHSAGVIRDNFIMRKTKEEMQEVLAPKVRGLVNIDQASRDLSLDFLICFSSVAGAMGNPGQADYAAANAFMDAYAKYRNTLVDKKQRHGRTLAINWPLWREGGMHINEETEKMMLKDMGIIAMRTPTGIRALYQGFASGQDQVMIVEGDIAQMKQKLFANMNPVARQLGTNSVIKNDSSSLSERVQTTLMQIAANLSKVRIEDIDADTDLNEYGFEPVKLTEFLEILNQEYGFKISPAIFIEYPTILGMTEYLLGEYENVFAKHFQTEIPTAASQSHTLQVDTGLLREKTIYQLKVLLGEITKLGIGRLDADEPLESYGIDSIMITQLNQKFADTFGELSKTLFFEYKTLGALAEYLIADHQQECMQWTGLIDKIKTVREAVIPQVPLSTVRFNTGFPVLASWKAGKKSARRSTVTAINKENREPIAIIGISGRYPQAKTLKEYWENLQKGKDCITEIPQDRWALEGFYHEDMKEAVTQGKSYSKWGGFIEGFAEFDPLFFNISPREALNMDPQERLFVESCWAVFEDAGYTREQLTTKFNSSIGVFAGITKTGFDLYGPDLWKQGKKIFPRTSFSSVANRISYLLNLHGPSMPIDTMCSSSLTALHEACEHLHRGECEMAIAGGVNLYLHPTSYIGLCAQQMLSADGQCKSFGQGGNGFVPGEGVGVVLLKPLSKAIADGDQIYAVIRGSSINHGGKNNGYTVPNPTAQGEVIRMALDKAGVNARTVSYIEAHGTGTELGDPIEITGLTQAFCKDTQETGFCAIGSVKSNIGHSEAAAGIAGVLKIILQMKNKKLVSSLHAKELNPNINFAKTPFVVQQKNEEWNRPVVEIDGVIREYPRIAGISSFGAGGSNAHIVIEEYIPQGLEQPPIEVISHKPVMIVLSAKNEERLREQAQQLLTAIQKGQFMDSNLASMAYTLQVGREAMEERLGLIVGSLKELTDKLKFFVAGKEEIEDLYQGQVKRNKESLAIFTADEDMGKMVDMWINKRKYAKLIDLWVKGLIFDWNKLYSGTKPQRISLPTYPFARENYWIPKSEKQIETHSLTFRNQITFYDQLIDEVMNDVLSIDEAVQKTENFNMNKIDRSRRKI
jgi:acyl transferase domain-containing protein/aryl carrier-like protein